MILLSIDPGYERVGIAIITKRNSKEILLHSECFKTKASLPHYERLKLIGKKISDIIAEWKPDSLAIEKLYFNTNQTTALPVSEARGVIVYEAASKNLDIFEYTPLQVKIAVTGYGRSDKRQISAMVPKLMKIDKKISSDDEMDAIAIGLTCLAVEK